MRFLLLIITAVVFAGTCKAQDIKEQYDNGKLIKTMVIDGIEVSTSLRNVGRNDGKYYSFDVAIVNGTNEEITVKTSSFRAALQTRKGLKLTQVLTRKEYMLIKKRRENMRTALLAVNAGLQAYNAGQSHSTTSYSGSSSTYGQANGTVNTTYQNQYGQNLGSSNSNVSVTGSSHTYTSGTAYTRSYNGGAAYAAAQNEAARIERFQAASAAARKTANEEYFSNNTLSPFESMSGFLNVKYAKSTFCIVEINVGGRKFEFKWYPSEAEN